MPTLDEVMHTVVGAARASREAQALTPDREAGPVLLAFRGAQPVAIIRPERANQDVVLAVARAAAAGYNVDLLALALVTDFYRSALDANPVTDRLWGPGELAEVIEYHPTPPEPVQTKVLWVCAYNRAGDFRARMLPYRVAARRVTWLDEVAEGAAFSGLVHDALVAIMAEAPIDVWQSEAGLIPGHFGLGVEEAVAYTDVATTRLLTEGEMAEATDRSRGLPRCFVALAAAPDTARERIVRRTLPGSTVIRP